MKISIIGAGNVGGTLGQIWAQKGHDVVFGVRDPDGEKMRSFLNSIPGEAKADSIAAAANYGEVKSDRNSQRMLHRRRSPPVVT